MVTPASTSLTTSQPKVPEQLMSRRLNTLVSVHGATVHTVAVACEKAVASRTRMRCLKPECRKKIDRPAAGRLPLFCSRCCRQAFDYERAELLRDIEVLTKALEVGGGTTSRRAESRSSWLTRGGVFRVTSYLSTETGRNGRILTKATRLRKKLAVPAQTQSRRRFTSGYRELRAYRVVGLTPSKVVLPRASTYVWSACMTILRRRCRGFVRLLQCDFTIV